MLEVGPGPGLLTRHLLAAGAAVVAVEIDPAMQQVAQELVEPELWSGDLTWVEADAMAGPRTVSDALRSVLPGCSALVANLPYAIAAPLLAALACEVDGPPRQVVMIQKELGQRLSAPPGGRDYGPLAVVMALSSHVKVLRKVPAQAFWPPPKVESSVLGIHRRADWPGAERLQSLQVFLSLAFHNRRKTLLNSVAEAMDGSASDVQEALQLQENEQKRRAEAFPALQLDDLARKWAESALGERYRP